MQRHPRLVRLTNGCIWDYALTHLSVCGMSGQGIFETGALEMPIAFWTGFPKASRRSKHQNL
jgi:hypothetical protein